LLVVGQVSGGSYALAQALDRQSPPSFQPDFPESSVRLLLNAAGHARDGQWTEAIEIYQRLIAGFGGKVARLPKDDPATDPTGESVLYVDLRYLCQRRLAALPVEARTIYRDRVDSQAEHWYRQGAEKHDIALLRRVIDQAFCSSWGDDALELLGDFAFQDGHYGEALSAYRQLVPEPGADPLALVYPDPSVDLARVAAKKLLCRAALGDHPPTIADLEAYAKAYPNASGPLAGRTGLYAASVAQAIRDDKLMPPAQPDSRWPTFAGSPTRTRIVPSAVDVGSLQWKVKLPEFELDRRSSRYGGGRAYNAQTPPPRERLLLYHPIILGDQVMICDQNRVFAFNLNDRPDSSGAEIEPAWKREESHDVPQATRSTGIPRYTLTAFGDRIFARMGPTSWPALHMRGNIGTSKSDSSIIAIDRSTEGKLVWRRAAVDMNIPKKPNDTRTTGFEGTPVADGRRVYVAMSDRHEHTAAYVAALDAETGAERWIRYVGEAASSQNNMVPMGGFGPLPALTPADFGHALLTLDGSTVYYQTNLGAVVALDAETGSVRWVATYPRLQGNGLGEARDRDLNPAVVHDGLVIVAPDDASAIYAFNAQTGRLAWRSERIPDEVRLAHVLGVAKGHVVATGDAVLLFDVKTGKLAHMWPATGGGAAYSGFGRGVLAGDKIFWPTANEIHVLDQGTGLPADPPIKLQESFQTSGGNLAVGDGYLIVAQEKALVVFCQNSRLIERYRDEIAKAPEQASNYYRLAQVAEAVGSEQMALDSLEQVLRRARPAETIDGLPLVDAAHDQQHHLLMKLGNRARSAKKWAEAATRYEAAAATARLDRDRLNSRLLLANVELERGSHRAAVDTLQRLLADEHTRSLSVPAGDGHRTIRANLLIADRLAQIIRDHGRGVYAAYDEKARALLNRGRADKDPHLFEEVERSYPTSSVVPEALLALGALAESRDRPAEAAYAYKRLLASAESDSLRGRALLGLGRAYEAQRLWVPSRDAYVQARARFGTIALDELGTGATIATVVAQHLGRPPFDRMVGAMLEPSLPIPLVRRWEHPLTDSIRPLEAEGVPPTAEASGVFLAQGNSLRAIDPRSGVVTWSATLGSEPLWATYLADKLIAASSTRIVALRVDNGAVEWRYDLETQAAGRAAENPFARDAAGDRNGDPPGAFQGFRVVGGRVFALAGNRKLLSFDGDTGLADWSFAATGSGTINPHFWIGPHTIVLQLRKPNAIVVLETEKGRKRAEFGPIGDDDWERDPLPVDDEHVALVVDPRTVAMLDLKRGTAAWIFRESQELPRFGPPRLLGDSERLLVVHDGRELIRLDPATGHKQWSYELGSGNLSNRPEAMAIDAKRVYWANDRKLQAVGLLDGKLAWEQQLSGPDTMWSIALSDQCVLAYPALKRASDAGTDGLTLVLRRREDGGLVQRLSFPGALSDVAVRLAPHGVVVAAEGGVWSLGNRDAGPGAKASP
jgi:outer membrane protein assembly factor BamB